MINENKEDDKEAKMLTAVAFLKRSIWASTVASSGEAEAAFTNWFTAAYR